MEGTKIYIIAAWKRYSDSPPLIGAFSEKDEAMKCIKKIQQMKSLGFTSFGVDEAPVIQKFDSECVELIKQYKRG
jgi:hypothetical protein